jgi:hypothetical protein
VGLHTLVDVLASLVDESYTSLFAKALTTPRASRGYKIRRQMLS